MTSTLIRDFGEQLLQERRISMKRIDDAVRRILRVKFRAGLFENPYAPYTPAEAEAQMLRPDAVAAAKNAASRSMVLLRNEGGILPLDPTKKTAVIGPLGNQHDMLGPWWGAGRDSDVVTVFDGINTQSPGATYAEGCKLSNTEPPHTDPEAAAPTQASPRPSPRDAADQVVLALGETREMSGEAAARSTLDLPGRQEELLAAIKATGKPYAVVLFNGRPLALEDVIGDMPALLEAWFPGVQAGHAVADVVFGKVNPGGKLPVSFPRRLGQVPIYYNHERTGRPCNPDVKWNSRHRDIPSCSPLFEFGFGLSYTTFEISSLQLSSTSVSKNGSIKASVTVRNTGGRAGDEVVQLYIHDLVASISQPVRRLRGFERVTLAPGQARTVTFTLDKSDFGFYDDRGKLVVEPGQIDVYAGSSSTAQLKQTFTVVGAVRGPASAGPLTLGCPRAFSSDLGDARRTLRRQSRRVNMCRWLAYSGSPVLVEELLYGPKLPGRPEPALADGSGGDERRRIRTRLVRRPRDGSRLPQHRAGMERPEPARPLGAPHVRPGLRAHSRLDRIAGPADELPSVPARALALDAQRHDPRVPRGEA